MAELWGNSLVMVSALNLAKWWVFETGEKMGGLKEDKKDKKMEKSTEMLTAGAWMVQLLNNYNHCEQEAFTRCQSGHRISTLNPRYE